MRRTSIVQVMAAAVTAVGMAGMAGMVVAAGGCAADAARVSLANAGDLFVNRTVGPEYENYVEHDPTLSFDEKRVRKANVEAFRRAVAASK